MQNKTSAFDMYKMMEQSSEPWKTFQEVPTILPIKCLEFYMFKSREFWCGNPAFEMIMWRAGIMNAEKQDGETLKSSHLPLIPGWNDVGSCFTSLEDRKRYFIAVA